MHCIVGFAIAPPPFFFFFKPQSGLDPEALISATSAVASNK